MQTAARVLAALKKKGNPSRVQLFAKHGGPADAMYGVSVADMKVIAKAIRGEQELAYELYETGNTDAMYLAGMVADGSRMTKLLLDRWAKRASWSMISEYTVPWVATESAHARALALTWMDSKRESVAACGWCTYSGHVTVTPDEELDLNEVRELLRRVGRDLGSSQDRVRYTMNGFVIAVGSYVKPLTKQARALAKKLGPVEVDQGGTSCKVPLASAAIAKVESSGRLGRKRKTIKC